MILQVKKDGLFSVKGIFIMFNKQTELVVIHKFIVVERRSIG